jgi:hypothetical protein
MGLSQRAAAKLHNGLTKNPSYRVLKRLTERYPVDPNWVLTGKSSRAWADGEDRAKVEGYWYAVELFGMFQGILEAPEKGAKVLRQIAHSRDEDAALAARSLIAVAEKVRKVV